MSARRRSGDERETSGSFRQKGPTRWELRVNLPKDPVTGKRRTRSKTIKNATEASARAALRVWVEELGMRPSSPKFFEEVLSAYAEDSAEGRGIASNESVHATIRLHLRGTVGEWRLDEITVHRLEQFYKRISTHEWTGTEWVERRRPLGPATIRHLHFIIRPALEMAMRWGWLQELGIYTNPADLVRLPRMTQSMLPTPTVGVGLAAIVAADPELGCFLRLLLATGARRGEVSALTWGQIGFESHQILIDRALSETRSAGVVVKAPKTRKSRRSLKIDPGTMAILHDRRAVFAEAGIPVDPECYVFPRLDVAGPSATSGLEAVKPATWSSRFARLKKEHGIDIRMHDLRHLSASMLIANNVGIMGTSKRLGHGRTSTTFDIYSHLLDDQGDVAAASVMESAFRLLDAPPDSPPHGHLVRPTPADQQVG